MCLSVFVFVFFRLHVFENVFVIVITECVALCVVASSMRRPLHVLGHCSICLTKDRLASSFTHPPAKHPNQHFFVAFQDLFFFLVHFSGFFSMDVVSDSKVCQHLRTLNRNRWYHCSGKILIKDGVNLINPKQV